MPRQKIKNDLLKGMNQDRAWSKVDPSQYKEASNIRLMTDDMGDSMGSVSTIRGNKFDFEIPDVGNVYVLTASNPLIQSLENLSGASQSFTLIINGKSSLFTFSGTEVDRFYSQMADHINNPANFDPDIVAQSDDSQLIIYSNAYNDIFSFNYSGWAGYNGQTNPFSAQQKTPRGTDLQIIGQTSLRESAILFTTPTGSGQLTGQIWRVTWDNQDQPTLTLVRHADDNFSLNHDIEAVGRYELPLVQRVYFTDFNNPLRSLNIFSESSFLDRVDISPAIKFDQPVVKTLSQNGGQLPAGWYSYAYRYKNLGGAETAYSQFSQPFPILDMNEETEDYLEYEGCAAGTATNKALTVEISKIDTSFQFIDIIVRYTEDLNVAPKYYYVEENQQLSGASSLEFDHHVIDDAAFVDETDITIPDTIFTKCKTLAIKDNRLLAGNLKDDVANIDSYDATCLRWDKNGTNDYENTTDLKNPYNKDETAYKNYNDGHHQYKYKKGLPELGGSGQEMSFKFVTKDIVLDQSVAIDPTDGKSPKFYVTDKASSFTMNGKDVPLGDLWNSYKNPFIASHFRGYMRSEVYRFGIVFFDKSGRALDVKWIADIRMPDHYEPGFNSYEISGGKFIGKALGVEFLVNVGPIKNLISGFSIVRAERTKSDETIIGQGLLSDVSYLNMKDDIERYGTKDSLINFSYKIDRTVGYSSNANFANKGNSYGRDTQGNMLPFVETLHTITCPQLLIADRTRDISGYVMRPIAALKPAAIGITNSSYDFSIVPAHYLNWYKFYGTDANEYFFNSNYNNNPYQLSISVEDSTYLPGMDDFNPQVGDRYTGAPYEDSFIGSPGGFINYCVPILEFDSRTIGTGTAQMQWGARGGHCHFINVDSKQWAETMCTRDQSYIKTDTPELNSKILSSNYYLRGASGAPYYGRIHTKTAATIVSNYNSNASKKLLFNLYRDVPNQYGGDSITDIEATKYISTGHYQAVDDTSTQSVFTATVFGGDTYINIYDQVVDHANENSDNGQANSWINFSYHETNGTGSTDHNGQGIAHMFPVESRINLDWRQGIHFARIGQGVYSQVNLINWTNNLDSLAAKYIGDVTESWETRENDSQKFFAESSFTIDTNEWDNRVWASDNKINGESVDSWRTFRVNEFWDVDGDLGPINKLQTFNDEVYYFQDRGFGMLSVNPNPIVQGDNISIALGEGKVLQDNRYISTNVGSKHQFSVFTSPRNMYWFDIINKKPYKFGGKGVGELSDIKGMHSFFTDNVDNYLLNNIEGDPENGDNPANGKGIIGVYDDLNNEALYTFLNPKTTYDHTTATYDKYVTNANNPLTVMPEGSIITAPRSTDVRDEQGVIIRTYLKDITYEVIQEYDIVGPTLLDSNVNLYNISIGTGTYGLNPLYFKERPTYLGKDFTLSFSEIVDAWSSFYDFQPKIYINTRSRLLTPNKAFNQRVHLHNVGDYNKWYGDDYKTHLEIVSNIGGDVTKVYDNVSWHTISSSKSGAGGKSFDQLTFDKYYAYNEYQHTGEITLDPAAVDPNIRRVEREWQIPILRNVVDENIGPDVDVLNPNNWNTARTFNDRMRDKFLVQHFEFDNSTSDKFTIDYINTYVRQSKR